MINIRLWHGTEPVLHVIAAFRCGIDHGKFARQHKMGFLTQILPNIYPDTKIKPDTEQKILE